MRVDAILQPIGGTEINDVGLAYTDTELNPEHLIFNTVGQRSWVSEATVYCLDVNVVRHFIAFRRACRCCGAVSLVAEVISEREGPHDDAAQHS